MTDTAGTAIAAPAAVGAAGIAGITLPSRYPGPTGTRNAAKRAGTAAGPQVPAAVGGRNAPQPGRGNQVPRADRGRPAAGHTWAAR
jgi:hypothetical protein